MEDIIDTSGFYKLEDNSLLHAQNFVYAKDYELVRDNKDQYAFPMFGWYWFDSRLEAKTFFNYIDQ